MQAGAKPNVFPLTDNAEDQITPLVLAAKFGHLNSIRALVEKSDGDLLNSIGPSGESVLHAAVRSNAKDIVDYVLKRTHNKLLEKTDRAGKFTILTIAIFLIHELIKGLLLCITHASTEEHISLRCLLKIVKSR